MFRKPLRKLRQKIRKPDGVRWTVDHPGRFRPKQRDIDLSADEQQLVDRFGDFYYQRWDHNRGHDTIVVSWLGYEMYKCPLDLWVYQEMIFEQRPDYIIECGTYKGGTSLYFANMLDFVNNGKVLSIDIDTTFKSFRPRHPRITYLTGSSTDPAIVETVRKATAGSTNRLVVLDSDHSMAHVLAELRIYREFVPPGGYIVVEDTNVNGHPTEPDFGPGPWEAVEAFLAEDKEFRSDRARERFLLTMNPRGYLRRQAGEH